MPSATSLSLSLRPSSSSSALGATGTLCPVEPGAGSQRSDSGADSRIASFGSMSGSPVNSRLACSQSDFDTSCAERPLMTASSTARSRTILLVTVPRPAEFSVKAPSFNGFVFMGQRLSPVRKGLCVMRRFHLARAAILARVAGFRKNIVPLPGFRRGGFRIGPQCVERLLENRRLPGGRQCGDGCFHVFISRLGNALRQTKAIDQCRAKSR